MILHVFLDLDLVVRFNKRGQIGISQDQDKNRICKLWKNDMKKSNLETRIKRVEREIITITDAAELEKQHILLM